MKTNYWKIFSAIIIGLFGVFWGKYLHPVFLILVFISGAIANDHDRDRLPTNTPTIK